MRSFILRGGITVVIAACMPLAAQNMMELHIVRGENPHQSVVISDVHAHEVTPIFSGNLLPLLQASFWLTNNSNKPIVGIATTWAVGNSDGSIRMERFTADSFLTRDVQPIIEPHHRLLVAPRLWVKEEQLEQYATSPYFLKVEAAKLERTMGEFARAAMVKVEVDAVIFADGEVAGRNKTGFDSEITMRKSAADTVLALVDKAGADPDAQRLALLRAASGSIKPSDNSIIWQHRFAQQLLHSRNFIGTIDYLRHLPSVPAFYGATATTQFK